MAQQTLLGGDGVTGESGATHNTKANANFTELYANVGTAQSTADSANTAISTHVSDATAAHAGSAIAFTPAGGLSSTDVQAAIVELAGSAGVGTATETTEGIVELATPAEVLTGTDTTRAVTVAGVNGKLRLTRTVTGAGAIVQGDDNSFIIFNSGSPFNFTLDQLSANTKISFINIGAGIVTFTAGSGVTITGDATLSAAAGTSYPAAVVFYHTLTTPRVIQGGAGGVGAVDSVNSQTGVVVLDAGDIAFTPAGTIAATTVQAAIEEVAAEAGGGGAVSSVDTATGAVLLETLSAVALSGGNLTLAWGTRQNQNFDLTTTLSGNATIIFSGSSRVCGKLFLRVTGTRILTFPSGTYMDLYEQSVGRWNTTGTRELQLTGVTASPFMLTFDIDAAGNTWVHATNRGVTT
jgi:hypothetical protein